MVDGVWCMDEGLGFRVQDAGSRVKGLEFRVWELGIRVKG